MIVNLREGIVEVHEDPVPHEQRFARRNTFHAGDHIGRRAGGEVLEIEAARILP